MYNIIGLAGKKLSTTKFGGLYPMSLNDHLSPECGAREYEQKTRAMYVKIGELIADRSLLIPIDLLELYPLYFYILY